MPRQDQSALSLAPGRLRCQAPWGGDGGRQILLGLAHQPLLPRFVARDELGVHGMVEGARQKRFDDMAGIRIVLHSCILLGKMYQKYGMVVNEWEV